MDPTLMTVAAAGLTLAIGAVAANYRAQYSGSLKVMGEVGQFIGSVSDIIVEIQKALADETVTPEEIKLIAAKLAKFKPLLDELQKMLAK